MKQKNPINLINIQTIENQRNTIVTYENKTRVLTAISLNEIAIFCELHFLKLFCTKSHQYQRNYVHPYLNKREDN